MFQREIVLSNLNSTNANRNNYLVFVTKANHLDLLYTYCYSTDDFPNCNIFVDVLSAMVSKTLDDN